MARIIIAGILSAAVNIACLPAWAEGEPDKDERYNAETMLRLCQGKMKEDPDLQSMVCTFRLQGLMTVMIENCMSRADGYDPALILTASPAPSRGALKQAFVNYVEDHPAEWGDPWHIVAAKAASSAFPCEVEGQ
ncbi:hypothetical protein [Neogemmobacter tilapiae]|uniref:Rap1a immunity protein domain-containing protein n=1 Tax=Neogemmobacter tilapiae TaxID=875041 RepID=A0A918TF21_9RHOB|nr:hypothetical protein [Gemmobacter tilapiae]GHC45531.1 hypothetical protein GCM10007315_03730 [Gemmobacter tilapiae]